MKHDHLTQLVALHAQLSAAVKQIEAMVDAGEECQHEDAKDLSTMGMPPGSRMQCNDCGAIFSRSE